MTTDSAAPKPLVANEGIKTASRHLRGNLKAEFADLSTAVVSADSDLSAADRTQSRHGAGFGVDLDGLGKLVLSGVTVDVKNVSAFRLAFEVNEMHAAVGVNGSLWLETVFGGEERGHLSGVRGKEV